MTIGVYVGGVPILAALEIGMDDSYLDELTEFPLPAATEPEA
jgi:hypothetical protein